MTRSAGIERGYIFVASETRRRPRRLRQPTLSALSETRYPCLTLGVVLEVHDIG